MADDNKGFADMNPDQQGDMSSNGGKSQSQENNPGNFANDPQRASEAGRKGGQSSHQDGGSSGQKGGSM